MHADTGSALVAAVVADPADDAPWLIYADWLQDNGRDAEADAVRRYLPHLRAAVFAGYDLSDVIRLAAISPPGTTAWEEAYGWRAPVFEPMTFVVPPSQPPAVVEPLRWSVPDEADGLRVSPLWLLGLLFVCLSGLVCRQLEPARHPGPPPAKSPADPAAEEPRPWDPAEVAGYTFESATFPPERLTFRPDGTAVVELANTTRTSTWAVDPAGTLVVGGPAGGLGIRLVKLWWFKDQYKISRDGVVAYYDRSRSE